MTRERRRHLRKNQLARMHQHATDIFLADVAEVANSAPNEIIDFRNHFYSRKTPARDNKGKQPPTKLQISFVLGFLHRLDQPVAQAQGVAESAKRQSVLG